MSSPPLAVKLLENWGLTELGLDEARTTVDKPLSGLADCRAEVGSCGGLDEGNVVGRTGTVDRERSGSKGLGAAKGDGEDFVEVGTEVDWGRSDVIGSKSGRGAVGMERLGNKGFGGFVTDEEDLLDNSDERGVPEDGQGVELQVSEQGFGWVEVTFTGEHVAAV